jgi:type IV secretory pathway VirJ component
MCLLVGCASTLASKPGVYDVTEQRLKAGPRTLHVTYVKPVQARRREFIVFASGDGGWRGPSAAVLEHLAAQGYSIAGIEAPEVIKPVRRAGERLGMTQAAERLAEIYVRARQGLGVAETTPMIIVGFSRGATLVALTAVTPALRAGLGGAIAIALTREVDYLHAPEPAERRPGIQVDKRDRILIYPAVKSLSFAPLAVIQSMRDGYVPASEARQLLGPDEPSRRLYEVEARNHRFGGGREAMLHDVDDALRWIEQAQHADRAH